MHSTTYKRIATWLDGSYDQETKEELRRLQRESPEELMDAFYRDLSFGTGGLRAVMGVGTNRMNIYTVRFATQGLANYLLQKHISPSIFIGYDVRNNSRLFAEETAKVCAGNGMHTLLSEEVCPTPLVSFGCRYYGCSVAIMITASHNPPIYNGYKVYGKDGAQIISPEDLEIIEAIRCVRHLEEVRLSQLNCPLIQMIGKELDEAYLKKIDPLQRMRGKKNISVIYTNLHGTGLRILPEALHRWGCEQVDFVSKQASLDGNFPFAPSPNPEEEKALFLGSRQLENKQADLLLATDPDADRLGAAILHENKAHTLSGNEIGALLLAYLVQGDLPKNGAILKTIVTSELLRKIANAHNLACIDVLTGFKFIAAEMKKWEEEKDPQFVFGAEESHGYLFHPFARDKDALSAGCLLMEAASFAKQRGKTLLDQLFDLYRTYGVHRQLLSTISFKSSPDGMKELHSFTQRFRQTPPPLLGSLKVLRLDDYQQRITLDLQTGNKKILQLPTSDVLVFHLEEGGKVAIRPSGTEPKVKIYMEVCSLETQDIPKTIQTCDLLLKDISVFLSIFCAKP